MGHALRTAPLRNGLCIYGSKFDLPILETRIRLENPRHRRSRIELGGDVINRNSGVLDYRGSAENLPIFDHHLARFYQPLKAAVYGLPNVGEMNRDGMIFDGAVPPLFPTRT